MHQPTVNYDVEVDFLNLKLNYFERTATDIFSLNICLVNIFNKSTQK